MSKLTSGARWKMWKWIYVNLLTPITICIWVPWPRWAQLRYHLKLRSKRYRCVHCARNFSDLEPESSIWSGRPGEYGCSGSETVGLC